MKKRIEKWFTIALAAMLIIGSVNYGSFVTNATTNDSGDGTSSVSDNAAGTVSDNDAGTVSGNDPGTVSGNDVAMLSTTDATVFALSRALPEGTYAFTEDTTGFKEIWQSEGCTHVIESGAITVNYPKQYNEIQFAFPELPEGSTLNALKTITVNLADGSATDVAANLVLKIYKGDKEITAFYNGVASPLEITPYMAGEGPTKIAIMNKKGGELTAQIASIALVFSDEKYVNRTYTLDQLTQHGTSAVTVNGNVLSLPANSNEIQYELPKYVLENAGNLRNVHVNLSNNSLGNSNTNSVCLKFYENTDENTDSWKELVADYWKSDLGVTSAQASKVCGIAIMNCTGANSSQAFDVTVNDVTFSLADDGNLVDKQEKNLLDTIEKAEGDVVAYGNMGINYSPNDIGKPDPDALKRRSLTFGTQGEIQFNLPSSIDITQYSPVQVAFSGMTGGVNVYLRDSSGNYLCKTPVTKEGLIDLNINTTEQVTQIVLQSNNSAASCVFDGVIFKKSATPSEEVNITPAGDGKDDISLPATAKNMTKDFVNKGVTATGPDDLGRWSLDMPANYQQAIFKLSEAVDLSKCTKVTFAVSSQNGSVAFRMYTAEDTSSAVWAEYGKSGQTEYTFDLSNVNDTIKYISVSSNNDAATCTFDGVMFEMEAAEVPAETYTITVYPSALTCNQHNTTSAELTADKKFSIKFSDIEYNEARLVLPENLKINMANCESITFNVEDQDGPVNFNAWLGDSKKVNYYYNTGNTSYVLTAADMNEKQPYTGEIDAVGVQIGGEVTKIVINSVVFTMKKTASETDEVYGEEPVTEPVDPTTNITPAVEDENDRRFTYKEGGLTVKSADKVTYEAKETEKVALSFDGAWKEIKFTLPEVIDLARCKSVTFAVSEQSTKLSYKLYDTAGKEIGKNELTGQDEVTQYSKDVKEVTIPMAGRTEKVAAVAIMLHGDDVKTVNTCVFDGVLFKLDAEAAVTHDLTYVAGDLERGESNAASCTKEGNAYVAKFSALNEQFALKLPKTINMANCVSMQVTVSGQTGPVNYYLDLDGTEKAHKHYNTADANGSAVHKVVPGITSGGINELRIQCGGIGSEGKEYVPGSGVTVEKVVFTMNGSDETNDYVTEEDQEEELVTGTENITPAGDNSYQAGTLRAAAAGTPGVEYAKTTTDQFQIKFVKQYNELKLTLPEAVNLLQCKKVTFAVSSQDAPVAFKLYNEANKEVLAKYDQEGSTLYTFDISSSEKVKYVGIMLNQKLTDKSCVFDGVTFEIDNSATTETYTITYAAKDLVLDSSQASSCQLTNGNYMIQFSDMDQNVNFKLPASVNLEKCVNIIVTVASQNGPMNFNVGLDKTKLKDYHYNSGKTVYTLEPGITKKINEFGIQCGRENNAYVSGSFVELVSVSFLMRGTAPKDTPADNNYTMDYFEVAAVSTGVTQTVKEDGSSEITFSGVGDSITMLIPDSVDVNHLVSIDFYMNAEVKQQLQASALNGELLARNLNGRSLLRSAKPAASDPKILVEILDADMNPIVSTETNNVKTNCNPEAKYIRFTSNSVSTVLNIDSIKFNVDQDAFESIVLNGNFAREDVSMWGDALWGGVDGVDTVITAKTSETPIFGDVYTYGEVSRRSSPYVSFAQNVTDRTTPGTGYAFSFWAKLSDDYKGASPELRTVEFAPYYFDANGVENYNMIRTGAYSQVLEPGVWTQFSGVVGLPGDATGFVIRIVEQGTNYGQGECVMGSYAVTGVTLIPAAYPSAPSYGGGGGSSTPVITKEATCEVGYSFKDLAVDWATATTSVEDDKLKIGYVNQYDEARLKLPRTLDMSTCAYIKVNVTGQNVPIAVKLYRKGQQVDVSYYNDIKSSYLMVPVYAGMIDAVGIMSLAKPNPANAYALVNNIVFGLTQEPAPEAVSDTIVINGDFADEDMSDWSAALWGDGVTITQQTASTPIYDDVYTYATYSRRTSPYQCFAQDITGRVEQNETYSFSFWAKLSDDYKDAPEDQRVVQFAPYTVDFSGKEDYNPSLNGTYSQVLEPGVWTYFEGTYKVTNPNKVAKVVIRLLEQGTNYGQGQCVKGSYSVAGVKMEKYIPIPPEIDEDVPNLKDVMTNTFGRGFITGTALTLDNLDDPGIELLVNKHFNAVTLGNELKPDALFNYSNGKHTELQTITFNGQKLEVPTLYFNRADEMLDGLLQWNEEHPDSPLQVRGHVLVWHSQTPEWFFREGYTVGQNDDGSENYVTPEVMNLRMEWYIKSVLEHYTGENSPYKDLFYGWDVVNEAVSNGGLGYRTEKVSPDEKLSQSTHSSNSSWWAIYQSNEYIINAFRFANKYAPADLELYYNDYNECHSGKVKDIVALLTAVKEAEGTRIDGMGMQAHYRIDDPMMKYLESAIRAYSAVVDKVQLTELDLKASQYINDKETRDAEYLKQAKYYHDIYMLLQKLNAEDGIKIGGITFWGVVDKYSWLQGGSTIGGGSDGVLPQCPLLFDDYYRVKPAYWAFVDYTQVDPDWQDADKEVEESAEQTEEKPEAPAEESSEAQSAEAESTETGSASTEAKKSSPVIPIVIAVVIAVIGAGAGLAVFLRKRASVGVQDKDEP